MRTPDQLWDRVLDWLGEPHATTAAHVDTSTETHAHERIANLGLAGVGVSGRKSGNEQHGSTDSTQASVNRRGLPQVVQELANSEDTILLDDFHYIPPAIQNEVAQQLKDAASRGVRICVANVPHRADNLVRALPELRGRVLAIDLDYWTKKDLLEIPKLGLPKLGLEIDNASLTMFAREAAGSPQLMQSICLWMCNHLGVRETADPPRSVQLDELARKEILFLTSCTVDFRTLVRALITGPKARAGDRRMYVHNDGRRADIYLSVIKAMMMDPPLLAIERDEIHRRLEFICNGAVPERLNIVNACIAMANIAQTLASTMGPSLEWDEAAQMLVLPDPYLLFYLRWSVAVEREADLLPG